MKTHYYLNRLARISIALAILWVTWVPAVGASVPATSVGAVSAPLNALPNWWAVPLSAPQPKPQSAPLLLAGGSTVSGTLTANDIWGPGTITVTGDIIISPTVTIVITPNTTVQVSYTDGLYTGIVTQLVEFIVSGTLEVNGPVTFTSISSPPRAGDWYGIRVVNGGSLMMDGALVEYATIGVELADNGPVTVTNSTIRYMQDYFDLAGVSAGIAGGVYYSPTLHGCPADTIVISHTAIYSVTGYNELIGPGNGGGAYGIYLTSDISPCQTVAFTTTIRSNEIYSVTGGDGGNEVGISLTGNGGAAVGIHIHRGQQGYGEDLISLNTIHDLWSGRGGDAAATGHMGGNGGEAFGMDLDEAYSPLLLTGNLVHDLLGGEGGLGGIASQGGWGGDAYGVLCRQPFTHSSLIADNTVITVAGGDGGPVMPTPVASTTVYASGWAGNGGVAHGFHFIDVSIAAPIDHLMVRNVVGGNGMDGCDGLTTPLSPTTDASGGCWGGSGGEAIGILSQDSPVVYREPVVSVIYGGIGGLGGGGGDLLTSSLASTLNAGSGGEGGYGGEAAGIQIEPVWVPSPLYTTWVLTPTVAEVHGGPGGAGGPGGTAYPDMGGGIAQPGDGGTGGNGGNAWGIRAGATLKVSNAEVHDIGGGPGAPGGSGGLSLSNENWGDGGLGGDGGWAVGIGIERIGNVDHSSMDTSSVMNVFGGPGGDGGRGGDTDDRPNPQGVVFGGSGGDGGRGGHAWGVLDEDGALFRAEEVTACAVYGGWGGHGGDGGAAWGANTGVGISGVGNGGDGGNGGEAYGLQITGTHAYTPTVLSTLACDVRGGSGGDGGHGGPASDEYDIYGGRGGDGGHGGRVGGIWNHDFRAGLLYHNEVVNVRSGDGGHGGHGGVASAGLGVSANNLVGGDGGRGGLAGDAWGVYNNGINGSSIARSLVHDITAGNGITGGNGGSINYVSTPGTYNGGNGGSGGDGGTASGVDSNGWMKNNLSYRIHGGDGGDGGNGGLDNGIPTANAGAGGRGGDGGVGLAFALTHLTPFMNNTGAKTFAGLEGRGGMGFPSGSNGLRGDSWGAYVVTATFAPLSIVGFFNNALISHTVGVFVTPGSPTPPAMDYNFISATIPTVPPLPNPHDVIGVAPGFVDFAGDDYHLLDCSSPAADAGTAVPVGEDGEGDERPWGSFDVGWDEYWPVPFTPPTFQGVITQDTTWSGTYLLTGDVIVPPTVTLSIAPGTTVYVNAADRLNLGVDPRRIELIVGGELRSGETGGITVTFTTTGCNPAPGQWYGIRFAPGSRGYLDPTIIEYGTHGVVISTTNPITIADSIIRLNRHAPASGDAWGAGVAIFVGHHLITNTQIYSNSLLSQSGFDAEGAGVYLRGGSTRFVNDRIHGNFALSGHNGFGGGMALRGSSSANAPQIIDCHVYQNVVTATDNAYGGGIALNDINVLINSTVVSANVITSSLGMGHGGGLSIGSSWFVPNVIISDSRVTHNAAYADVGWAYGGGVAFPFGNTASVIRGSMLAWNRAEGHAACGGGIGVHPFASAGRFDGDLLVDNLAQGHGGGAGGGGVCLMGTVTATNNLLYHNVVSDVAYPGPGGGGVYVGSPSYLLNNTVVSNSAYVSSTTAGGGGIYMDVGGGTVSNTIVVSNSTDGVGGGIYYGGGSLDYNDVWDNSPTEYHNTTGGAHSFSLDPIFIAQGDLVNYYHLQQGSPCIDAGTSGAGVPDHDYDGQSRPLGSGQDIGFDEVEPLLYGKFPTSSIGYLGEAVVYTITVVNADPIAPASIIINDVLPAEVDYDSHSSNIAPTYSSYYPASRAVWWNGVISPGETLFLNITTTVKKGLTDGLQFTNTAAITVARRVGYSTNVATTTVDAPVLTITKIVTATPVAGGPLTYTLIVTNTGHGGATDVVITDALPSGAHYLSGGTLMPSGWVSWTYYLVAAGHGTAQFTFAVTTCQATITNTHYRVVTSTQGVGSGWGAPLVTHLAAPTIIPDFTVNPSRAPVGYAVQFIGQSSTNGSSIVAWSWDFGDGNVGSGQQVSHAYTTIGTFTVTLTVTDSCGYVGKRVYTNAVEVVLYTPVFEVGKRAVGPLVVGAPFTYTIVVTNSGNLTGTGVVVTDALPSGGYYVSGGSESGGVVSLTVGTVPTTTSSSVTWVVSTCQTSLTNEWYRVASSDQGVGSDWGAPLLTSLNAPSITPDFSWTPVSPGATDEVTFTASIATNGSAIAAWAWDFGDGGTAAGQTATHSFGSDGTYTVTLTVTDTCGYTAQVEKAVTVASCRQVDADFGWTTPVLIGKPVTFTVVLTDGTLPITYTWTWGDGSPDTVTSLTTTQHTYAISGTVHVSLSAENSCTNQVVATHDVVVEPMRIYLPLVLRAYP